MYDRQWMIVSESGFCINQKRESRLCQIRPEVHLDTGLLLIYAPGMFYVTVVCMSRCIRLCSSAMLCLLV